MCKCVCTSAVCGVSFCVKLIFVARHGPRYRHIVQNHKESQKCSQSVSMHAYLPLFPPSSLSLYLSLGSWPGTTISGNGFFAQKMKVKLFRAALINVFYVAPKSMLQFSFALCSSPKFPTRPSWPMSVCVCVSLSLSLPVCVCVCAEVLGVMKINIAIRHKCCHRPHTHTLALTHTRGKRSTARAN